MLNLKLKKGQKVIVHYYVPGGMEIQLLEGTLKKQEQYNKIAKRYDWYTVQIGDNEVLVEGRNVYLDVKSFLIDRVETCDYYIEDYKSKKERYEKLIAEKNWSKRWLRI